MIFSGPQAITPPPPHPPLLWFLLQFMCCQATSLSPQSPDSSIGLVTWQDGFSEESRGVGMGGGAGL